MTTVAVYPPRLGNELGDLAIRMCAVLLGESTSGSAVRMLTSLSLSGVPNAIGAGVTLVNTHGVKTSVGATSEAVLEADALQYHLGVGPCLDAHRQATPVRVADLRRDCRWSAWAKAVRPLNVASLMSIPLISGRGAEGTLKIYCDLPGAFDERTTSMVDHLGQTVALLLDPAGPRA